MVGADVGGVEGADAVVEHAHAVAAESADDGAAGTGAVVGGGDAGERREGFAERGLFVAVEVVAAEDGGALDEIKGGFRVGIAGDDDGVEDHGLI